MEEKFEISSKWWVAVGLFVAVVSIFFLFAKKNKVFLIFMIIGIIFILFGIAKYILKGKELKEKPLPNKLPEISIIPCFNCKNKVYSNYKFCPWCGHKL